MFLGSASILSKPLFPFVIINDKQVLKGDGCCGVIVGVGDVCCCFFCNREEDRLSIYYYYLFCLYLINSSNKLHINLRFV